MSSWVVCAKCKMRFSTWEYIDPSKFKKDGEGILCYKCRNKEKEEK